MKTIKMLLFAMLSLLAFNLCYGAVSAPPAKVQKLSTGESIDEFSADVKLSTGANKALIDTKQNELSTDTWKAADSDKLDGLNYDAFVSTAGGAMSGDLVIEKATPKLTLYDGVEFGAELYVSEDTKIDTDGEFQVLRNGVLGLKMTAGWGQIYAETIPIFSWDTNGIALGAGKTIDGRDISEDGTLLDAINLSTPTLLSKSSATATYLNINQYETGMSTGVSQIKAGANISISPTDGRGVVTIAGAAGGGDAYLASTQTFTGKNTFVNVDTMTVTGRINWPDGSYSTSALVGGGGGAGGQPDIVFSYMGDVYNSTSPYVFNPQVSKYNFTMAKYDIDIGSATTDSFTIRFAKKSFGGSYTAFEDVTIPASVSSHTYTSSGVSISDGDIIEWGFLGVDATDAAGDISVILRD